MKTHKLVSANLSFSLSLILASSFFVSCQKSSDDKPAPKASVLLELEKQVPTAICSNQMLQLNNQFRENQIKAKEVYDSMQIDSSGAELKSSYKKLNIHQAETCKALNIQFSVDKMTSCLRSVNQKTIENSIYQSTVENSCKTVIEWFKKMTLPEGSAQNDKKESALVLKFNESARSLLQGQDTAEFAYLANRTIKKGRDQFGQDVLDGNTTCAFQTSAESSLKETQFLTISEMPGSSIDLGFEFKGTRFSLALEDSQKMMLSMTCYNLTMGADANKKDLLQKAFGDLISISNKLVISEPAAENDKPDALKDKDAQLNKDLAPAIPASNNQEPEKAKEVTTMADQKQKKANEAMDDMIAKAKTTIHEVAKDTLAEVKATTDQVRAETIVEVKKAAQEVSNQTIANAAIAAKEVSKVVIQDVKAAAHEVVTQSITTVKTAVIDTIKAPFVYVTKKAVEAKDSIVYTTIKAVNYVEDKAIEVKNFLSNSVSPKDYWSTFFSSKSKK